MHLKLNFFALQGTLNDQLVHLINIINSRIMISIQFIMIFQTVADGIKKNQILKQVQKSLIFIPKLFIIEIIIGQLFTLNLFIQFLFCICNPTDMKILQQFVLILQLQFQFINFLLISKLQIATQGNSIFFRLDFDSLQTDYFLRLLVYLLLELSDSFFEVCILLGQEFFIQRSIILITLCRISAQFFIQDSLTHLRTNFISVFSKRLLQSLPNGESWFEFGVVDKLHLKLEQNCINFVLIHFLIITSTSRVIIFVKQHIWVIYKDQRKKMMIDPYTYYKIIFDINFNNQRGWLFSASDDASSDYYDSYSRKLWIGKTYSNWKIVNVGSGCWQFVLVGGKYDGWMVGVETSPKEKNLSWVKLVSGACTGTYWRFVTPQKQFNDNSKLIIQNTYNNQYLCANRGRNEWKRNGESTFLITHANIKAGPDQLIWKILANGGSSLHEKKIQSNAQIIQKLQASLTQNQQHLAYYQKRCASLQQEMNQINSSFETKVKNLTEALHQTTEASYKLSEERDIANNDALKYSQLYKEQQESFQKKSKEYDQLLSQFYQYKCSVEQNQQENAMSLEALKSYMEAKEQLQRENRQMRDQLISMKNQHTIFNQQIDQYRAEIQKLQQCKTSLQNELESVTRQKQSQYWKLKGEIDSADFKLTSSLNETKKIKTDLQAKHKKIKKNYQIKANYFRDRLAETMKPSLGTIITDFMKENEFNRLTDQNAKLRWLLHSYNISIPDEDNYWINENEQNYQTGYQNQQNPQNVDNLFRGIFGQSKNDGEELQSFIDNLQNEYKVYLADMEKRQQIQRQKQSKELSERLSQMQMSWNPTTVPPKQINWWINFSHPDLVYKKGLAKNILEDDDIKRIALTNTYFHPFNNPNPNIWLTFKIKKLKTWMGIGIIQCPQTLNFDHSWCEFDYQEIVIPSGSQSGYNSYMKMMGMEDNSSHFHYQETVEVVNPQKRTFYMLTSSGKQLYNLKQGNCSINDAPFKFQTGDEITIYYNTMRESVMFQKGKESFEIMNIDSHPGENYVFVAVMEGLGSAIQIKDYDA